MRSSYGEYGRGEGSFIERFAGPDGMLYRIKEIMEVDIVQYMFLLLSITFVVARVTKGALRIGPLGRVIEDDRGRTVTSLIIGVLTSNFVFFSLRAMETWEAVGVIYGVVLMILAPCAALGLILLSIQILGSG